MKQLLIIKQHSFIDVITNSSTELFVCNTNKSEDYVKRVIQELVSEHNLNDSYTYQGVGEVYTLTKELMEERLANEIKQASSEYYKFKKALKNDSLNGEPISDWSKRYLQNYIDRYERIGPEAIVKEDSFGYEFDPNNIGCVLVFSADDNSIPYEVWDKIEYLFDAKRYHLG